jgi:hypothetical protein
VTFAKRAIDVMVQLGKGDLGEGGFENINLSGLRVSAVISKDGIPAMNLSQIRVYGLTPDLMNSLSRIGLVPNGFRNNVVSLMAGDPQIGMSTAFSGAIIDAWPDFQSAPDVAFNITAQTGYLSQMKSVKPTSYTGPTDAAVIIESLAKQIGYVFENNGVSVILASPYLWGTARQQIMTVAAAADIFVVFDDENGKLAILPKSGARGDLIPLISPQTGMVGYPVYSGPATIRVRTLYNPAVQFMGRIKIASSIAAASGLWRVIHLTHKLDSQMPDGDWFTEIVGDFMLANRPAA